MRLHSGVIALSAIAAMTACGCRTWSEPSGGGYPGAYQPWPAAQRGAYPSAGPAVPYAAAAPTSPAAAPSIAPQMTTAAQPIVRAQDGAYCGWAVQPVGPEARSS